MKFKSQRGFSLVELMITVSIVAILSAIAIPSLLKYQRDYKFWDYASQMEYLVKMAKIYAMERTTNVGVCADTSKQFSIYNIGPSRNSNACANLNTLCISNNNAPPCLLNRFTITEDYLTIAGTSGGVSIDPRGLAILPGFGGTFRVCYGNKSISVTIHRAGIRTNHNDVSCS